MDRGAWQAIVHGVTKSQTRLKQLSIHAQSMHLEIIIYGLIYGPIASVFGDSPDYTHSVSWKCVLTFSNAIQ